MPESEPVVLELETVVEEVVAVVEEVDSIGAELVLLKLLDTEGLTEDVLELRLSFDGLSGTDAGRQGRTVARGQRRLRPDEAAASGCRGGKRRSADGLERGVDASACCRDRGPKVRRAVGYDATTRETEDIASRQRERGLSDEDGGAIDGSPTAVRSRDLGGGQGGLRIGVDRDGLDDGKTGGGGLGGAAERGGRDGGHHGATGEERVGNGGEQWARHVGRGAR
nr:hypothetical protein CFP56_38779 [Quercus suber]